MKLKSRTQVPELAAPIVLMALSSWSACPRQLSDAESDAAFTFFQGHIAEAARVWSVHERFLRSEAKRLGIEPTEYEAGEPAMHFAEHCAWLLEREPHLRRGAAE